MTLALLAAAAPTERFLRGETIASAEMRLDSVYVLLSGRAEIWAARRFDRKLEAVIGAGGVIGDLSLTTDEPFGFTAVAAADIDAVRLGRSALDRLFVARPEIALSFARAAARAAEAHGRSA